MSSASSRPTTRRTSAGGAPAPLPDRFSAQLLTGPPAADAVAVTRRLLAVQAQDPRGARLAVRARTSGLTAADVDRALTEERSLVITWVNRGTLHLICADDHGWLHTLTTPQLVTGNARRLRQEGVDEAAAERGVRTICRALAEDGPLPRGTLRERLDEAGVPTAGQAVVHVLMLASLRGLILRGPMVGREHAFVLVEDWLGPAPAVDRDAALAELARRYLAGHGPATDRDLAKWAGITLGAARAALRGIAGELEERAGGLVGLASRAGGGAAEVPPPRLLGPYDPLLHGWADRTPITGEHTGIVTSNGLFRAFALVDGRAAGLWSLAGGEVDLTPFGRLRAADRAALGADAADVRRFLGLGAG